MGTADQDHDTAPADEAPETEESDEGRVADQGGDSDPAAAAGSDEVGEEQAARNREDESPA